MLRLWIVVASSLALWNPATAHAQAHRYFEIWSYRDNTPIHEIAVEHLGGRELGYWQLEFDAEGYVVLGTYHGSDQTPWLTFRYVEAEVRVYADLYVGTGDGVASLGRKSTLLENRAPRWPPPAD